MNLFGVDFLSPIYFVLILLVPIFIFLSYNKKSTPIAFYSDIKKVFKRHSINFYFKLLLISLLIISYTLLLANPNIASRTEKVTKNGIDIVLLLDISESMMANDLSPNRLVAAKNIINEFIKKQVTNRIGLVIFAGRPFESIPLTFDYNIYEEVVGNIETTTINQGYGPLGGTAIGDAIMMGETLFEEEDEREKVIILVSDGESTHNIVPTSIASEFAKEKGIKIYSIGIGSKNGGQIVYNNGFFDEIATVPPLNENELKEIARISTGEYFRADSNNSLVEVFENLEKLEKKDIEIETKKAYNSNFEIFAYTILLLLFLFIIISLRKLEI